VVSFDIAWLVLAVSVLMSCRDMADACGSTYHEAWLAVRPALNAAGLATAGP
jgi:hypothetical protein